MHTSIQAVFVIFIVMQMSWNRVYGQIPYGFMADPPARGAIWRFGFPTLVNYNDNALDCGGYEVLQRAGRCGVCGDSVEGPRDNEAGGQYASGTIVKSYPLGTSVIPITIETMEFKPGYFEFRLCPHNDLTTAVTQTCLDNHLLRLEEGTIESHGTQFRIPYHQSHIYTINAHVPEEVSCSQCVLQWTYSSGNESKIYEEYRNCADISILPPANSTNMNQPDPQTNVASNQEVTHNDFLTALMLLADVSPSGDMNVSSVNPLSNTGADKFIDNLLNSGILVPVSPDVSVLGAGVVAGSLSGTALLNQNPIGDKKSASQNESTLVHESRSWTVQPIQNTNGQDFLWYSQQGNPGFPNQHSSNVFGDIPTSSITQSHTTMSPLVSNIANGHIHNFQPEVANAGQDLSPNVFGGGTGNENLLTASTNTMTHPAMTENNANNGMISQSDNSMIHNHVPTMSTLPNEQIKNSWNNQMRFPSKQSMMQSTQSSFETISKSRLQHAFSTEMLNFDNVNFLGRKGFVENTTPSLMNAVTSAEFSHKSQAATTDQSYHNHPEGATFSNNPWLRSIDSPVTGSTPVKIFFNVSGMDNLFTIETLNNNSTKGGFSSLLPPGSESFLTWKGHSDNTDQHTTKKESQSVQTMDTPHDSRNPPLQHLDHNQITPSINDNTVFEKYPYTPNTNDYSVYVISSPDNTQSNAPNVQNIFENIQGTPPLHEQSQSDNFASAGTLQSSGSKYPHEKTVEHVNPLTQQTLDKPIQPSQTTSSFTQWSDNGFKAKANTYDPRDNNLSHNGDSTNFFSSDIAHSNKDRLLDRRNSPTEQNSNTYVTSTPTFFDATGFEPYNHFSISHPTDSKANSDFHNLPQNSQFQGGTHFEVNTDKGTQNNLNANSLNSWNQKFKATQTSGFETVSDLNNQNTSPGSTAQMKISSDMTVIESPQTGATTNEEATVQTAKFWRGNPFGSSSLFVHKSSKQVPLEQASIHHSTHIKSTPASNFEVDAMQQMYKDFAVSHPQPAVPTESKGRGFRSTDSAAMEHTSVSNLDANNKATSQGNYPDNGSTSVTSVSGYSSQSSSSQSAVIENVISVPKDGIKYHTKEPWIEPGIETKDGNGKWRHSPMTTSANNDDMKSADVQNIISVPKEGIKYHTKEPWIEPGIGTQDETTISQKLEVSTPNPGYIKSDVIKTSSVASEPFVWSEQYPKDNIHSSSQDDFGETLTESIQNVYPVHVTPPLNPEFIQNRPKLEISTNQRVSDENMYNAYNNHMSSSQNPQDSTNLFDRLTSTMGKSNSVQMTFPMNHDITENGTYLETSTQEKTLFQNAHNLPHNNSSSSSHNFQETKNTIGTETKTVRNSNSIQNTPSLNEEFTYTEFNYVPSKQENNLEGKVHNPYGNDQSTVSQKFLDTNTVDLLHMAGAAISHTNSIRMDNPLSTTYEYFQNNEPSSTAKSELTPHDNFITTVYSGDSQIDQPTHINNGQHSSQIFGGTEIAKSTATNEVWIQQHFLSTQPLHASSGTNRLMDHSSVRRSNELSWNSNSPSTPSFANNDIGWIKDASQSQVSLSESVTQDSSGHRVGNEHNTWMHDNVNQNRIDHPLTVQKPHMLQDTLLDNFSNEQLPPNVLDSVATTTAPSILVTGLPDVTLQRKAQGPSPKQFSFKDKTNFIANNNNKNNNNNNKNNNNNNNNNDDGSEKPILLRLKGRRPGTEGGTLLVIKNKSTLIRFLRILKNMSVDRRRQMFKHLLKRKVNKIEFRKKSTKPKPKTKPLKLMWTMSPKIVKVLKSLSKTATGRLILKSFRRQLKQAENGAYTGMSETKTPQIQMKILPTQSVLRTIANSVKNQISSSTPPSNDDDNNGSQKLQRDLEHNKRLFSKIQIVGTALKNRLRKALLIEKNLQFARKIVTALRLLQGRQKHLDSQIKFMQRQLRLINEPVVLKEPVVISVGNKKTVLMPSRFMTRLKNNLSHNS